MTITIGISEDFLKMVLLSMGKSSKDDRCAD